MDKEMHPHRVVEVVEKCEKCTRFEEILAARAKRITTAGNIFFLGSTVIFGLSAAWVICEALIRQKLCR